MTNSLLPDNDGELPKYPVFPCLECDLGFETAYALESHNRYEHPGPCKSCGQPMSTAERLAGPYCVSTECPRRGAVILPPLDFVMRRPPASSPTSLGGEIDLTKALVDSLNGPGTFDKNRSSGSPPAEQRVEDILAKDDLSAESCPHCGKGPLSRCTTTHHANWGDNPKVDFAADGWLCAYCGEEILTLKQADQWTMNLLKQTVSSLKEDGLTAEEAQSLLNNIGSLAVSHPHFQIASRSILAKFRRISQSRGEK